MSTRFRRTRGGQTIHTSECRHARGPLAVPWEWAEGRSFAAIAAACDALGLRLCKTCQPLEGTDA